MKKQQLKKNLNIYITKNFILSHRFSIFLSNYEKKSVLSSCRIKTKLLSKVNFFCNFKYSEKKVFFPKLMLLAFDDLISMNNLLQKIEKKAAIVSVIKLDNLFFMDKSSIDLFLFKISSIFMHFKVLVAYLFMKFYFIKKKINRCFLLK